MEIVMKIFRLIEMRGSASKGFALLLMLIFVREARAQRCPTLSGRNKTICFNAALEDNAFIITGNRAAGASFRWYRTDNSVIANPAGGSSLSLSSAAYTEGQTYTYSGNAAGMIHEVRVTQTAAGCTESSPASIFVIQQPQLATPSQATTGVGSSGACIGLSSVEPSPRTVGTLHFDTEIFWNPAENARFSPNPSASSSSLAAITISPEPSAAGATRSFSYIVRYKRTRLTSYNVSSQACQSPPSPESALISVWPRPSRTGSVIPVALTVCSGVNFNLTLTGHSTDDGATSVDAWEKDPGNDISSNNLEITDANAVGGTYAYRPRLVRNNGIGRRACKALSAPATVTVLQFEIGDPSDVSVCSGDNTTFTCVIDNQGGASPVLQWQVNKTGTWINDDTGTPESRAALTLQLQDIPAAYNGYQYRLQASNGICTKNSAPASLAVSPKPVFTKDLPLTRTACERDTLSLRARGNGIGQITYQWKRKAPGAGT